MKKKTQSLFNAILISAFIFVFGPAQSNQVLKIGNEGAKITVKVFSSLTCPHCASFHNKVFNSLKTEYIDTQKIKHMFEYLFNLGLGMSFLLLGVYLIKSLKKTKLH